MQLHLVRHEDAADYPKTDVSVVTLMLPSLPTLCSLCLNRRPVWQVAPTEATAIDNFADTPLGSPDACKHCLNELIETGTLRIMHADPDAF